MELIIEFEQIVVMTVELSFMHKMGVLATGATYKNLNKMKYCYWRGKHVHVICRIKSIAF